MLKLILKVRIRITLIIIYANTGKVIGNESLYLCPSSKKIQCRAEITFVHNPMRQVLQQLSKGRLSKVTVVQGTFIQ